MSRSGSPRLLSSVRMHQSASRGDPLRDILADIRTGMRRGNPDTAFVEIPDRRKALYYALDHAQPGDMIAVIGKGHETTLQRGGETLPFCEREILQTYMKQKKA